jgi:hypothetical protein
MSGYLGSPDEGKGQVKEPPCGLSDPRAIIYDSAQSHESVGDEGTNLSLSELGKFNEPN